MIEIKLDGQRLWWGIIEAVNDYRLQPGVRSLTVVARSRDAFPVWREARRVTDIYPRPLRSASSRARSPTA